MNVVFAADYIASNPGAFIISLKYLAEKLNKEGYKIAFLFSEHRNYLNELEKFGSVYICNKSANRKFSWQSVLNMLRACIKINADIVHIQFIGIAYLLAAVILKPILGYKLIIHWRCIPESAIKENDLYHKTTSLFYNVFSKLFIDAHIAISQTIKEILIKKKFSPQTKVYLVYNGIDTSKFTNSDYRKSQILIEQLIHKKLDSSPVIGMIADYSIEKDHETFLRAAELVLEKHSNAIFLLVGSERKIFGKGRRHKFLKIIESLNRQDNIIQIDDCPCATEIIHRCDIGVLCSHYEGFGNVLVEFMMAGKPVIGTRVGGIAEIIRNEVTGYLIPPGDYFELADKINYLIEKPELRKEMGLMAKKVAEEKFTLKGWIDNICTLYFKIISDT